MDERRKVTRKQTNDFFGVYHRDTDKYIGKLFDMSTKGMMIVSRIQMNVDAIYEFRIDLPKHIAGKSSIIFDAKCVWCRENAKSKKKFDAGFQITSIEFDQIETIQYLLNDSLFHEPEERPRVTLFEKTS